MLNRRTLLAGLGGLTVACTSKENRISTPRDINFVLVHGAWHGGWCWEFVKSRLEATGANVLTPTLTGLGNRQDELSPAVSLDTHINDVVNAIDVLPSGKIILVGHSYGGMAITGAANRIGNRLTHLVYLDSVVPSDGQSMLTAGPEIPQEILDQNSRDLRALSQDGGVSMQAFPPEIFGIPQGHDHYEWAKQRLTPHPLRTWFDPISLPNEAVRMPRTFIHCVSPAIERSSIPYFAQVAKSSPDWNYFELATGHDAMITDPEGVAEKLLTTI